MVVLMSRSLTGDSSGWLVAGESESVSVVMMAVATDLRYTDTDWFSVNHMLLSSPGAFLSTTLQPVASSAIFRWLVTSKLEFQGLTVCRNANVDITNNVKTTKKQL